MQGLPNQLFYLPTAGGNSYASEKMQRQCYTTPVANATLHTAVPPPIPTLAMPFSPAPTTNAQEMNGSNHHNCTNVPPHCKEPFATRASPTIPPSHAHPPEGNVTMASHNAHASFPVGNAEYVGNMNTALTSQQQQPASSGIGYNALNPFMLDPSVTMTGSIKKPGKNSNSSPMAGYAPNMTYLIYSESTMHSANSQLSTPHHSIAVNAATAGIGLNFLQQQQLQQPTYVALTPQQHLELANATLQMQQQQVVATAFSRFPFPTPTTTTTAATAAGQQIFAYVACQPSQKPGNMPFASVPGTSPSIPENGQSQNPSTHWAMAAAGAQNPSHPPPSQVDALPAMLLPACTGFLPAPHENNLPQSHYSQCPQAHPHAIRDAQLFNSSGLAPSSPPHLSVPPNMTSPTFPAVAGGEPSAFAPNRQPIPSTRRERKKRHSGSGSGGGKANSGTKSSSGPPAVPAPPPVQGLPYDEDPVEIDTTKRQLIVNYLPQRLTNERFRALFRPYGELYEEESHIIYDFQHHKPSLQPPFAIAAAMQAVPKSTPSTMVPLGASATNGALSRSTATTPLIPSSTSTLTVEANTPDAMTANSSVTATTVPENNTSSNAKSADITRGGMQRSKGYGFIYFKDGASTERAVKELNGREVDGKKIKVRYADQQRSVEPRDILDLTVTTILPMTEDACDVMPTSAEKSHDELPPTTVDDENEAIKS